MAGVYQIFNTETNKRYIFIRISKEEFWNNYEDN